MNISTKTGIFALALILCLFVVQTAFSQMNNDADGSTVEMMQVIELNDGIEFDANIHDYIDKIEVIGWSRNGLVAYRYADDGGGYGGVNYCFVILNTINDNIIEQDSFNSLDVSTEREKNEYRVKWNSLLEKHRITGRVINPNAKIDNGNVLKFPFGNFQSLFDYNIIDEETVAWKLLVYNTGNPTIQKTVTHQTSNNPVLRRIRILGYHKSPYENRIAVFVSHISSFSGNVHFTPKAFGCNMNVGFN